MSDWWPETSMQRLRRANGWRPNDGAPGINYEAGDRAAEERTEPAPVVASGFDWQAWINKQSDDYMRRVAEFKREHARAVAAGRRLDATLADLANATDAMK